LTVIGNTGSLLGGVNEGRTLLVVAVIVLIAALSLDCIPPAADDDGEEEAVEGRECRII
jgi:hypothetical protein